MEKQLLADKSYLLLVTPSYFQTHPMTAYVQHIRDVFIPDQNHLISVFVVNASNLKDVPQVLQQEELRLADELKTTAAERQQRNLQRRKDMVTNMRDLMKQTRAVKKQRSHFKNIAQHTGLQSRVTQIIHLVPGQNK